MSKPSDRWARRHTDLRSFAMPCAVMQAAALPLCCLFFESLARGVVAGTLEADDVIGWAHVSITPADCRLDRMDVQRGGGERLGRDRGREREGTELSLACRLADRARHAPPPVRLLCRHNSTKAAPGGPLPPPHLVVKVVVLAVTECLLGRGIVKAVPASYYLYTYASYRTATSTSVSRVV